MNEVSTYFWGKTKYWWLILLIGILLIPCGIFYWIWPVQGYAVSSILFGWALVVVGLVQVVVGGRVGKVKGRAWWIIGGFIDLVLGFVLAQNVALAEDVFPYFLAFIFLYWGILDLLAAFGNTQRRLWWLNLINGILLCVIGFMFLSSSWQSSVITIDFLVSLAFIYWGISLCVFSYALKEGGELDVNKTV